MAFREKDGRFIARPRRSEDDVNDAQPKEQAIPSMTGNTWLNSGASTPRDVGLLDSKTMHEIFVAARESDMIDTESAIMYLLRANEGKETIINLATVAVFCIRRIKENNAEEKANRDHLNLLEIEQMKLQEEIGAARRKARG